MFQGLKIKERTQGCKLGDKKKSLDIYIVSQGILSGHGKIRGNGWQLMYSKRQKANVIFKMIFCFSHARLTVTTFPNFQFIVHCIIRGTIF